MAITGANDHIGSAGLTNRLSFFCLSAITYTSSLGTHLGTGRRDVKKAFCVVKCALTLTATVLSH